MLLPILPTPVHAAYNDDLLFRKPKALQLVAGGKRSATTGLRHPRTIIPKGLKQTVQGSQIAGIAFGMQNAG